MKNIISKSGEKSLSQKCDKKINLIKINSIVDKYLEKTLKKTLKNIKNNTINNINLQNGGVSFCAGTTQCVYLNPYDCHSTNMSGGKVKKKIQSGGAISLPSEYFGGVSGRYFESGSPNLGSTSHSFGYNMNTNNGFGGLDPHIAGNKVTEFQTGGGKIKNKKGGATVLPSEYFGGISGRYYELGDPKLGVNSSSFGSSPIKNNSLITSLDKIHIGGTSQESDPSLKIGSTPNINSTAHACSSCGPSCTTALFAGGAVTNNMFNDIKSLFNKKIFNELILIKLKKLNKEDVVITENAKDKLRFLTEIYLMKKLFCN